VKGNKVTDFLSEHLPVKTFEALSIPLKIIATNFWTREEIVFESGELIPAIRASISVPGLFKPVRMGGMVLIDGGAANPLPMSHLRDACDILIAVDVSGTSVPSRQDRVPTMFESVMVTFQILETAFIQNQLQMYRPELYIKPLLKNIQLLDFHRDKHIRKSVQEDVKKFKRQLLALLSEHDEAPARRKSGRWMPFRRHT
jgi:NTE family protein